MTSSSKVSQVSNSSTATSGLNCSHHTASLSSACRSSTASRGSGESAVGPWGSHAHSTRRSDVHRFIVDLQFHLRPGGPAAATDPLDLHSPPGGGKGQVRGIARVLFSNPVARRA
ncbi:MAG: hypothetical protein GTO03_13355, partial [Planctomycetales bacterium]|nr:hypothetical protein [Planctomycetales bacterium]